MRTKFRSHCWNWHTSKLLILSIVWAHHHTTSTFVAGGVVEQGMVWLDGGDHEAALVCFEEACTVDGANASVHFYKTVALVKV